MGSCHKKPTKFSKEAKTRSKKYGLPIEAWKAKNGKMLEDGSLPCTTTPVPENPLRDTGIPSIPGHFSLHPAPGVELNIQVTKIS